MSLIPEGWFENDGCTFWFDNWFGVRTTQCCDIHDKAFNHGTTVVEFFQANFDLMVCGFQLGVPVWAILTFCGSTVGGAFLFFMGRKAPKENKAVTPYEMEQKDHTIRDKTGSEENDNRS